MRILLLLIPVGPNYLGRVQGHYVSQADCYTALHYAKAIEREKLICIEIEPLEGDMNNSELKLGDALKGFRAIQVPSMGIRALAAEINISPTTLCRVEGGHMPDHKTLIAIWGWLTMPRNESHN